QSFHLGTELPLADQQEVQAGVPVNGLGGNTQQKLVVLQWNKTPHMTDHCGSVGYTQRRASYRRLRGVKEGVDIQATGQTKQAWIFERALAKERDGGIAAASDS